MSCMEKIRAFYNKEQFEYSQGSVDPHEFHKVFYFMCKLLRVTGSERAPKWTIMFPILFVFNASIASILCCLALIKSITIFDVSSITESGTYFIIMIHKLLILSCTFADKDNYQNFLEAMREDFEYICTKGHKYREKFFVNHLWTWKASILSSLFIAFLNSGIIISANTALVYFLIYPAEGGFRPLPFPFWAFDVDFTKTPNYEVVFLFFNVCVCTQIVTYSFMMQAQIVWIRQIMSKADVIIWSIEDLLVDVQPTMNKQENECYVQIIKARMRDIVKMHHSMYRLLDDYAGVYRKLLMYEQKFCGPVMCLTAYCAAEKIDAGEYPGILILLCVAGVILNYIPSYLNTILAEKVESIKDACWGTPFWNPPGVVLGPYFVLIMQTASRPLSIQAPGFDEVSLQTFSDKVKFAYSGFNMLRQVNYR